MGSKLCAQQTASLLSEKPGGFFRQSQRSCTGVQERFLGDGGCGCPCCGSQNFCAALRRTLEILTAATRSPRFLCHWQRSVRSPRARCALAMTGLYMGCGARPGGSSGRPTPTHRLPIELRRGRRPRRPVPSQVAGGRKGLPYYRFNFPCGGPGRQRRFGQAYIRFPRGIALLQRRKAPDPAHRPGRGWGRQ